MNRAGQYIKQTTGNISYTSYQPAALPPSPNIQITPSLLHELVLAHRKLTQLNTLAHLFPNIADISSLFIQKEALFSSQIEGIQATLDDIFIHAIKCTKNISEVFTAIHAITFALEKKQNLPLCNKLLCLLHTILFKDKKGAGIFRHRQNWIGKKGCSLQNATYIPPSVEDMQIAIADLENYILTHDEEDFLIKTALIHYQFETIHPFLDGNGRIGRILILLCLFEYNLLHAPLLSISSFFKKNQFEYYAKLSAVRDTGDYEQWIIFFLRALSASAEEAIQILLSIKNIDQQNKIKIISLSQTAKKVYSLLYKNPIITIKYIQDSLHCSRNTANSAILALENGGILEEMTKQQRNKIYMYSEYINIIKKDI